MEKKEGDVTTKTAWDKAVKDKAAKDAEVVAKNKIVAVALATDNTAQVLEFELKEAWIKSYSAWKHAKESEAANKAVIAKLEADKKTADAKKAEIVLSVAAATKAGIRNKAEWDAFKKDSITALETTIKSNGTKVAK